MKSTLKNVVFSLLGVVMLGLPEAATAQTVNPQGGVLGSQMKPHGTPWVAARTFPLNMAGANPWGYIEVMGPGFQRVAIEQVSVVARTTAGTTLRCAFDMSNQPGAQFLPFVYVKTSPVNRLGTEVIASEKILTFLGPGEKGHFRCHAYDGSVEGSVSVTLIGRYE